MCRSYKEVCEAHIYMQVWILMQKVHPTQSFCNALMDLIHLTIQHTLCPQISHGCNRLLAYGYLCCQQIVLHGGPAQQSGN